MREVATHVVNPANDRLKIEVLDEPGSGGANHAYFIHGFDASKNPGYAEVAKRGQSFEGCGIVFQQGPIDVDGVNGLAHEALLAIIIDRLQSFQSGPYKCRENALALTHLEDAMHWLAHRTRARMRRGVEGTHTV